jgi:biotin transport system substrate-specific component
VPVQVAVPTLLDRSLAHTTLAAPIRVAAVGLAVAVTAAAAQFTTPVPFTAVPFTLTPLAVVLTGAALGSRLGAASQVLYVLLGALGLAVFSPSVTLPPGALRLVGPTGGYLLAYPLAAFASGWLAERGWGRRYLTSFGAMLVGMIVIHSGGVGWLSVAFTHSLTAAVAAGSVQFLLVDIAKAAVAAMILPQAWRLVGPAEQMSGRR